MEKKTLSGNGNLYTYEIKVMSMSTDMFSYLRRHHCRFFGNDKFEFFSYAEFYFHSYTTIVFEEKFEYIEIDPLTLCGIIDNQHIRVSLDRALIYFEYECKSDHHGYIWRW